MNKKKIIKSLKRIKKFCKCKSSCNSCPVYDDRLTCPGCMFRSRTPNAWRINDITERFSKKEE